MRLVAYVRVSEESENPENQLYAIYEWCAKRGHQVVGAFSDIGVSGALPPKQRPGFSRALSALESAEGLVVHALDRVARSLVELVDVVREIESRGKVVLSVREEWLQSLDPRVRTLVLAVLGWAAEMEREFARERTREALKRLRAAGKKLGRPRVVTEQVCLEAVKYVERGYALRDAAKILGVGYTTLARALTRDPKLRELYYAARARAKSRRK